MTDRELATLARRAATAASKAQDYAERAQTAKDQIREELTRRDTRTMVTGGWRITLVEPEVIEYDQKRLKRMIGSTLYDRTLVTKREFDKSRLLAMVQEGDVTMDQLEKCSRIIALTPYARITEAT